MTTDLKNVNDHPANVVKGLNTVGPRPGVWYDAQHQLNLAAMDLRQYEEDHGITFVALDNDGLERVREAYSRPITTQGYAGEEDMRARWVELEDAICDLLGLDD